MIKGVIILIAFLIVLAVVLLILYGIVYLVVDYRLKKERIEREHEREEMSFLERNR